MQQFFKVIITDNLNRDYVPDGLVTMAMSEEEANQIADLVNNKYKISTTAFAKVVPAEQPLNLSSPHDLVGNKLPYNEWILLTGADALPKHVAQYWYDTTILKQPKC